jgi:hypothetical protein
VPGGAWRRHAHHWALAALCGVPLLTAGASFAAPSSPGNAQSLPAVPADHECEALLFKVEKQISDSRTVTPPDDNALVTWESVILRVEHVSPAWISRRRSLIQDSAAGEEMRARGTRCIRVTVTQTDDPTQHLMLECKRNPDHGRHFTLLIVSRTSSDWPGMARRRWHLPI